MNPFQFAPMPFAFVSRAGLFYILPVHLESIRRTWLAASRAIIIVRMEMTIRLRDFQRQFRPPAKEEISVCLNFAKLAGRLNFCRVCLEIRVGATKIDN